MEYKPTDKQMNAIAKMESFCNIKSNRTEFSNKAEFDDYFTRLQARGNKLSKTRDKIKSWETSYAEIRRKKQAYKDKHYSDFHTLKSYAVGYINRYFPSIQQTEEHLLKKNRDLEMVSKVVSSVKHLIDEKTMIDSLVRQLKGRGKNINFISTKLYAKRFDGVLIKEAISKLREGGTLIKQYSLDDKIAFYKDKWKSKQQLKAKYIERGEDKNIVEETIERVYGEEGEIEILESEIKKMQERNIEWKKIISKLLARGFQYKDITAVLNG